MKKIILLLSIFFIFSINVNANDNLGQVFKIESYEYSDITNGFDLVQYGSSVYLNNGLIYTNAHVVLDEENNVIGNYRICKTISFKDDTKCFSIGKLLYYDTKNDLAVLEVSKSGLIDTNFSNKDVNIGDVVGVYGYPLTGGTTITYTEGKISGYENGLYKIDANLDSGNSGGGVFDSDGNLLGLAVSVKVGYSSLGYVIPVSKIKDFIKKTDKNSITENKNSINSRFFYFNTLKNSIIGSNKFSNNDLNIKSFKKKGFDISEFYIDNDKMFYNFSLSNKNKETFIDFNNNYYIGIEKYTIDDLFNKISKTVNELKKLYNDGSIYKVKKIKLKGKNTILSFFQNKESNEVYMGFEVELSNNKFLSINIYSDNIKNKSFLEGLKIILMNIDILDGKDIDNKDIIKLDNLSFLKNKDFYIVKQYNGDSLTYFGEDISITDSLSSKKLINDIKEYNLSTYLELIYGIDSEYLILNEYLIKKTNSGNYYISISGINNEYKNGTKVQGDDKYFTLAMFFDKIDDKYFYLDRLRFTYNDNNSKIKIDNFLNTISTRSSKLPFELGNIKVGENLVK